jgi:preprotein translocase subunit SecB
MTTATKASFSFVDFKVNTSYFDFNQQRSANLNIAFTAKGKHFTKTNLFKLALGVKVLNSTENLLIDIETESVFNFEEMPEEQLHVFFIKNAPAIVFPYIRAYIGTLTTQSGHLTLLLPTLNMSNIADDLGKNIEKIDD